MTRIVLVDDDKSQLKLYEQELTEDGYEVITATGGHEALAEVQELRPDLVILDVSMPGMGGMETLGKILGVDETIPVIINTAYAQYRHDFLSWAADAYVVKSSDLSELKRTVKKVLTERTLEVGEKSAGAQTE